MTSLYIDPEIVEGRLEKSEISDVQGLVDLQIRPLHNGGRREGDLEVPDFLKGIIADISNDPSDSSSRKEIAEHFNVSEQTVTTISHGLKNPKEVDEKLQDVIDKKRESVHESSVKVLEEALALVGPKMIAEGDKLKAKDVMSIAKDASAVIRNTSKENRGNAGGTSVIIYAPSQRKIDDYRVIEVTPENR